MPSGRDRRRRVRLRLASNLEDVALLGAAVRAFALEVALEPVAIDDLELASVEAANNIVIHGYAGASDRHYVAVIDVADGELRVSLSDDGEPIPKAALAPTPAEWSLDGESRRGVAIMRVCTDRLEYGRVRGRNRLRLVKRLEPGV